MKPETAARVGYLDAKAARVRAARLARAPTGAALERLRADALERRPPPSLREALADVDCIALIAEFKRRSPSGGVLADAESPADVAVLYRTCGARAVSVLTDADDFGGSLDDLAAAAVATLPTLRKDFLVDAAGLYEARFHGASAALLIAGILPRQELESLLHVAVMIGIECLVEVHDEDELDRALDAGADLIGINNRNLQSLSTDLAVTERLAHRIPPGAVLVSESGIRTAEDVARVGAAGAHAVLVGEALMRAAPDTRCEAVRALSTVPRRPLRPEAAL